MTGLRRYMRDMNEWLRDEMQLRPIALAGKASAEPPVHAVMEAIGCPASEWYRILLTRGPTYRISGGAGQRVYSQLAEVRNA